jgi:predicted nucleic acid-binding protein
MAYLLDTNVVCESMSRKADPQVLEWLEFHSEDCFLSCVTLGEIWKGIHRMPAGKRKAAVGRWAEELEENFGCRCLALNTGTLKVWGKLCAANQARGFNLGILDSLIAATALDHKLPVVTRNTKDFPREVKTFNPWVEA